MKEVIFLTHEPTGNKEDDLLHRSTKRVRAEKETQHQGRTMHIGSNHFCYFREKLLGTPPGIRDEDTTTKINVYDASFNVAFKTMSSFNYALMFNDIEFKVSLS